MTQHNAVRRLSGGQPPAKIIAVPVSYRGRAMERGCLPLWPSCWRKPSSTLAVDGDPVLRPPWCEVTAAGHGAASHVPRPGG